MCNHDYDESSAMSQIHLALLPANGIKLRYSPSLKLAEGNEDDAKPF